MTKQKQDLYDVINTFSSFFNAEDLHEKVSEKNKKIGLATVYRFLKTQEEQGTIHSFLCDNRKIYSISNKNHVHFTCEPCGKKQHITAKKLDFLKTAVPGKVCHFQIDISGICEKCIT
jgi:Fur family transcriptional regulator, ferric uptake regulator